MHAEFKKQSWSRVALFFLLITSMLGLIIRILPLQNYIANSYFYGLLQSHSHTGFLGWVFIAVYILILNKFGESDIFNKKKTKIILTLITFFIGGMTVSFPFFGYNFISISFLSLFLAFSYYALYYLFKSIRKDVKTTISYKFIKASFFLYLLSSISPWALGPIMAMGYKKTALYYNDIFFYLHFLYNGFIVFATIGVFFLDSELAMMKNTKIKSYLKDSFRFLLTGTILNYSESVLWTKPHFTVYILAFISSILLLIGVYKLWKSYKIAKNIDKEQYFPFILNLALIFFLVKSLLQLLQSFPLFSSISYDLKSYFIIGYIHLVTLGFITPLLFSMFLREKILQKNTVFLFGLNSYLLGFFLTELLLFGQGLLLWNGITFLTSGFHLLMMISSIFLFTGLTTIFVSSYKKIDLPA